MDFYLLAKEWVKNLAVSIALSFLTPQKVKKDALKATPKRALQKQHQEQLVT